MTFQPSEIAEKEFLITLRGYDRNEVRAFLRAVAAQCQSLVEMSRAVLFPPAYPDSGADLYSSTGEAALALRKDAEDEVTALRRARADLEALISQLIAGARSGLGSPTCKSEPSPTDREPSSVGSANNCTAPPQGARWARGPERAGEEVQGRSRAVAVTAPQQLSHAFLAHHGALMILAYLLAFGMSPLYATLYWLRDESLSFPKALTLAHLFNLYGYVWLPAAWIAVWRIVSGKRWWAKTARTLDAQVEIAVEGKA